MRQQSPLERAARAHIRSTRAHRSELRRNDDSGKTPWEWIPENRWIKGNPWSWDAVGPKIHLGEHDHVPKRLSRAYLKRYVNDRCALRSLIKCRQSEMTEGSINDQLHLICTRPGTNVQHVFPIDETARKVSRTRILPAISKSPKLAARVSSSSVHLIEFSNGSYYTIVGSLSKTAGRTTEQDLIVYDEYDFLAAVEAVMDEQLSHSALQWKWRFSTPTAPNVGIDKVVQEGCEFIWRWPCESCGTVQDWKWPDNLINWFEPSSSGFDERSPEYLARLNKVYFGCSHCGAWVDRNSAHYEELSLWEPMHTALVDIHNSYRVVGGMIPWKTGKEILGKAHKLIDFPTQFMNEVWGSAHIGGENRLHESELLRCTRSWRLFRNRTPQMRHVSVGIDVEKREVWITVRSRGVDRDEQMSCIVAFWHITEATLDELNLKGHPSAWAEACCRICERYEAERIVIDANGIGARDFDYLLNRFPQEERVWGAFFDTAEKQREMRQSKLLVPLWNKGKHQVTFSEVNELRKIQGEVRRGRVGIPAMTADSAELLKVASKHHAGTAIQPRWDTVKEREFEIAVRVQQDNHLLCANMYARIGEIGLTGHGTNTGPKALIEGVFID